MAKADAGDGAAANFLTAGSAIDARSKLGERSSVLDIIIMHSAMYHYLLQAGMLTFSSETLSTGEEIKWGGGGIGLTTRDVAFFAGMRIIVTDNIEVVSGGTTGAPNKYPVYMCSSGAIAEGVQQDLLIEADRNILSLQDVMSVSMHTATTCREPVTKEQTIRPTQCWEPTHLGSLSSPTLATSRWFAFCATAPTAASTPKGYLAIEERSRLHFGGAFLLGLGSMGQQHHWDDRTDPALL